MHGSYDAAKIRVGEKKILHIYTSSKNKDECKDSHWIHAANTKSLASFTNIKPVILEADTGMILLVPYHFIQVTATHLKIGCQ